MKQFKEGTIKRQKMADKKMTQIWSILFFDEIGLMNDEVLGRCCKSLFLI